MHCSIAWAIDFENPLVVCGLALPVRELRVSNLNYFVGSVKVESLSSRAIKIKRKVIILSLQVELL